MSEKVYCRDCSYCERTGTGAGSSTFRCGAPCNMTSVQDWYSPKAPRFKLQPGERNHVNDCEAFVEFGT